MTVLYGTLGADTLTGGSAADQLFGGPLPDPTLDTSNDLLSGGARDDTIYGYGGADTLLGGDGVDWMFGGEGNDSIDAGADGIARGEAGDDTLVGYRSVDRPYTFLILNGNDGNDRIVFAGSFGTEGYGDAGNDTLLGSALAKDYLVGGGGDDWVEGSGGADILSDAGFFWADFGVGATATGNDTLLGGTGADSLFSSGGVDRIDGGTGIDSLRLDRAASTVGFDFQPTSVDQIATGSDGFTVVNVEAFSIGGSAFNDTLGGLDQRDSLYGFGGDDQLAGGAGYDYLYGGDGNDQLDVGVDGSASGGAGDDTLFGSRGGEGVFFIGGDGYDRITITAGVGSAYGGAGNDRIFGADAGLYGYGEAGADTLVGAAGADNLDGGDDADRLAGGAGDDILVGGAGIDRLRGGSGDDRLTGGDGRDFFVFNRAVGNDTISDYAPGLDGVLLKHTGFMDPDAALAALTETAAGALLRIDADSSVLFAGLGVAELAAGDFLLR